MCLYKRSKFFGCEVMDVFVLKMSYCHCSFRVVDVILIPTPFYGVITEDLLLYSDVRLFHVPLDCEVGLQSLIYCTVLTCCVPFLIYWRIDIHSISFLWILRSPLSASCDLTHCQLFYVNVDVFFLLLFFIYRPMAKTVDPSTSLWRNWKKVWKGQSKR